MRRYLKLFSIQLKASALLAMQYRADFLLESLVSAFWSATAVVPLWIVFQTRSEIAGWSYPEALIVFGWFMVLEGVLEGAINPSLITVVDHIRKGTLDFVLLKPADAQFLVSTSRFVLWRVLNVLMGVTIFIVALIMLKRVPSALDIAEALVLWAAAMALYYSLWILIVSLAFYVVRVDNLSFLITSIVDAARWPIDVFRGVVRWIFTFVLPLALVTTYPARALLGSLTVGQLCFSLVFCLVFSLIARMIWLRSIARYTSASS